MINELYVLRQLKTVIATEINEYITDSEERDVLSFISESNVVIDFPDEDQMPQKVMFYLQPNTSEYEALSTTSDYSSFSIDIFVLVKRDKQENLTRQIYGYFNAMYSLLRNNTSLDGTVDFCDVKNAVFYPAVGMNKNVQAVNAEITIRYTKDF